MKSSKAFTLIEILLVVALAAGIFALSAPFALNFYQSNLLEDARSSVISALREAKHNAVLQKNDSAFGVHLETGSYTVFQGDSYEAEDNNNEVYPVIDVITFSEPTDIVFSKLTGVPTPAGTIVLTYDALSKSILIDGSGVISKAD